MTSSSRGVRAMAGSIFCRHFIIHGFEEELQMNEGRQSISLNVNEREREREESFIRNCYLLLLLYICYACMYVLTRDDGS